MQNKWVYSLTLLVLVFVAFYFYQKYKVAPDLELKALKTVNLQGEPVDLSEFTGQKTVLCFGASWCGPCREELKVINSIKDQSLKDINVVVVSDEAIDRVEAFKQHSGSSFTWLKLTQPFNEIGINSIPTTYLVNAKGKIVKKTVGYIDWKDESTVNHLKKLLE